MVKLLKKFPPNFFFSYKVTIVYLVKTHSYALAGGAKALLRRLEWGGGEMGGEMGQQIEYLVLKLSTWAPIR